MSIYQENTQEATEPSVKPSSIWRRAGVVRWLPYVLFFALLANIPFWVASRWLDISQNGWFCLEYISVGLLALFVPRLLGAVLLLLAIAVDVLAGVCETYFLSVTQCLTNLGAVRHFSGSRLLAGSAVVLLVLLTAFVEWYLAATVSAKYRLRTATCLIAFAILYLSVDCVTVVRRTGTLPHFLQPKRSFQDLVQASYLTEVRVSRSPTVLFVHRKIFPIPTGLPIRSAAAIALGSAGHTAASNSQQTPNLVVILVESWGLDKESSVSNALVQPYAQPSLLRRYEIFQGTVPFYGSTVAGEARELCGSTIGFQLMQIPASELEGCLPKRLDALGYHTVALHGMDGAFFDRTTWYQTIGFQEAWFRNQFQQEGLPNCPSVFPGTCDAAIAEWIGRRLEENSAKPEFVYWVTLNSHLPVPTPSPLKTPDSCSFAPSLAQQPSLCSWYQLVANVHHSVADMVMTDLARPTIFVIVGDHAPPFSDSDLRNRFSSTVVPYILLVPRKQQAP